MTFNDRKKHLKEENGFLPPGLMVAEAFGEEFTEVLNSYHKEIWGTGVIPLKYRYLIATATAVFDNNEKRAKLEIKKAVKHGATKEELIEVIKQQVWMLGAPSLVQVAPLIQFINKKFEEPED